MEGDAIPDLRSMVPTGPSGYSPEMQIYRRSAAACLVLALLLSGTAGADPRSAVVLGTTLIDSSTEGDYYGKRDDESRRIGMVTLRLAEAFAEQGWTILDRAPLAEQLDRVSNPSRCNGCDARLAREIGADVAVTAEVQKVSNLILTINIYVREGESGTLIRLGNADIRSNTDRSWRRGVDYILENRIFPGLASETAG